MSGIDLSTDVEDLNYNNAGEVGYKSYVDSTTGKRTYEMILFVGEGSVSMQLTINTGMIAVAAVVEADANVTVHGTRYSH